MRYTVYTLKKRAQLRWAGYVTRMPDARLPKILFYGKLQVGNCSKGGQKKRHKDTLKPPYKTLEFWEEAARERAKWRCLIRKGADDYEAMRICDAET